MRDQGAMTFGEPGKDGARVHDLKDVEAILDVFQAHGHNEVSLINSAFLHCPQEDRIPILIRLTRLAAIPAEPVKNIWERLIGRRGGY